MLPISLQAQSLPTAFAELENASLLLLNPQQQPVMMKDADKAMIPASTTKLITAFLALKQWGPSHRFHTDFYLNQSSQSSPVLTVKGYGDPFLVSEEIERLAKQLAERLKSQGVDQISHLALNTDHFKSQVILPGRSASQNPYDAIPSALAANFNTLNIKRQQGVLVSAEPQTPLTPLAKSWASRPEADLSQGRINLGSDSKRCEQYFAELLSLFLTQQGIRIEQPVKWRSGMDDDAELVYQHFNRLTLAEMIQPMMRYSTNFIANQLVLMMSAERYGAPATPAKVARLLQADLQHYFGWQHFSLEDGAGLSRQNRLSARQLVTLLEAFKPWRQLLPEVLPNVYAKSGTLIGVTTLAGYIEIADPKGKTPNWAPFALLINESASYRVRNQIAQRLKAALNTTTLVSAP
ncbi:peptidase S13 [Hydrogenovibrio sp. SC-1]|uniref:D-alanyl-D-alanine carboxypeptidase/D-alanyl-D-alanine-endopeptidase n=1 Tax=Hydrogenovibrio sp. SC-1 TaxID=2065820 RepID=UPI000C7A6240|nr:D-alanyl-D-alanine carboxypeptidase [Hydrogenovibrio sp. SC-1]PLA74189.1 peptidase S13 [Hydrogenovibrio sp. SC-1]